MNKYKKSKKKGGMSFFSFGRTNIPNFNFLSVPYVIDDKTIIDDVSDIDNTKPYYISAIYKEAIDKIKDKQTKKSEKKQSKKK